MEYPCRQFYGFKSLADVFMNDFADLQGTKIITVPKSRYSILCPKGPLYGQFQDFLPGKLPDLFVTLIAV